MYSTRYYCPILIKLILSRQIFEKYSNIKYCENPSNGSRVVPYGQTDMTKLIVSFRNLKKARNSEYRVLDTIPDSALSCRCGRRGGGGALSDLRPAE